MSFEVLLTQIVNLPTKYFINEEEENKIDFDRKMKEVKLPAMLLERLKKEFDENFEVSKRSNANEGAKEGIKDLS